MMIQSHRSAAFLNTALLLLMCLSIGQTAFADAPKADAPAAKTADKTPATKETQTADPYQWKDLFDGKTLTGWKVPHFGGEGKVAVRDGAIVMEQGSMMTGIVWTGSVIRNNYELTLEGKKLAGCDFFCTTTFPVGDDPCTLVVGGWGGMVVGLSNVDGSDASENDTTKTMTFKENQWYKVRIRVTDVAIEAWIGDEQMINQPRAEHKFDIRIECEQCRPLGVCTWDSTGAVRNIRVRALKPAEPKMIKPL